MTTSAITSRIKSLWLVIAERNDRVGSAPASSCPNERIRPRSKVVVNGFPKSWHNTAMPTTKSSTGSFSRSLANASMQCRGVQFRFHETHRHTPELVLGTSGFHFCPHLVTVDGYYKFHPVHGSRVFVVQYGPKFDIRGDIGVTDEIVFLHEITANTLPGLLSAPQYSAFMADNMAGLLLLFAARCDEETLRTLVDAGADVRAYGGVALGNPSKAGN